ncbi:hypothetical protein HMPREF1544_07137 [Mucor circinelloides 1006PhL]|uniref:Uncharacterized protein n=1 Tax=Mucor circinelloides f. circinelloides (strain 1006PhL) TaxID=1220926 RepID=S2J7E8_MUCC1|nr:hypothetical protein HMPREF1544_07137 [Mucor circinelloides 1006PhL]
MSDISSNSHISLSTRAKSEIEELDQTEFVVKATVAKKFTGIMKSSRSLKNKLDGIEEVRVNNSTERAQKEVFRFILNQHLYKRSLFSHANISNYSEEDFKLKFWAHILEEVFGYSNIHLNWGDTVPGSLSKTNVASKMDLRISAASSSSFDYSMTEFAKECTSRKYYLDKLKLVLMSKLHLNSLMQSLQVEPTSLHIPFMQIMGFECHLLHLVLVKPKQYALKQVATISYPITKELIDEGGIEKLIDTLAYVKESALEMKAKISSNMTSRHTNKINNLLGESSKCKTDLWTTAVRWPDMSVLEVDSNWVTDNGEDDEDEDEDDEEDEDEEEEEGNEEEGDAEEDDEEKDDEECDNEEL